MHELERPSGNYWAIDGPQGAAPVVMLELGEPATRHFAADRSRGPGCVRLSVASAPARVNWASKKAFERHLRTARRSVASSKYREIAFQNVILSYLDVCSTKQVRGMPSPVFYESIMALFASLRYSLLCMKPAPEYLSHDLSLNELLLPTSFYIEPVSMKFVNMKELDAL